MAAVSGSPPVAERRRRRDRTRWGPDDDGDATAPAAPSETQIPADPTAAATLQPAPAAPRPKRSRWASEDTDVKAVVPGLPVPVSLPPSLAGLVDANPQAMLLHRQLSAVSYIVAQKAGSKCGPPITCSNGTRGPSFEVQVCRRAALEARCEPESSSSCPACRSHKGSASSPPLVILKLQTTS